MACFDINLTSNILSIVFSFLQNSKFSMLIENGVLHIFKWYFSYSPPPFLCWLKMEYFTFSNGIFPLPPFHADWKWSRSLFQMVFFFCPPYVLIANGVLHRFKWYFSFAPPPPPINNVCLTLSDSRFDSLADPMAGLSLSTRLNNLPSDWNTIHTSSILTLYNQSDLNTSILSTPPVII